MREQVQTLQGADAHRGSESHCQPATNEDTESSTQGGNATQGRCCSSKKYQSKRHSNNKPPARKKSAFYRCLRTGNQMPVS